MARKQATPKERPVVDGKLVLAARAMDAGNYWEDRPYKRPYHAIARAFLDMPDDWGRSDGPRRRMREFDGVLCDAALRWIARVRERDFLSSILLTDALDRLMEFASALGETREHYFPTPRCKRELTMEQGRYFLEFEVPEDAALRFGDEALNPGARGIALVERCHLSESVYWSPRGKGVIPGFGGCRVLLGFNIPCDYLENARFDGDELAEIEQGGRIPRIGCYLPFGFVVGSRSCRHGLDEIGPSVPRLPLDAMVALIEEVARTGGVTAAPTAERDGSGGAAGK